MPGRSPATGRTRHSARSTAPASPPCSACAWTRRSPTTSTFATIVMVRRVARRSGSCRELVTVWLPATGDGPRARGLSGEDPDELAAQAGVAARGARDLEGLVVALGLAVEVGGL